MCLSQQLRRARDLLSWSLAEVSEQSGLAASIVQRAETGDGPPDITLTQLARLQGAFEAAGVKIGYDGTVTLNQRG
ncbi:MAG: helix-turn-helix transcriptional regulator [Rhodospirillales bacterium]|nr:helix-turn-helix transcriptional regulator [Acetobacter sp.]